MKKPEPVDKFEAFMGLFLLALSLVLSVFPAWFVAILGGAALEIITGLPYDYGFWIAAVLAYLIAVVYFSEYFYSTPEPRQQASGSGFLLGFIVGRFFK